MSEEYMNPNLEKNRYIYNIMKGWSDYDTINVRKYPIIYSNKDMTYYKVPGSMTLCSVSNFDILDDLDKVSNALAKNRRYCNIFCLVDPGHSYVDKQTLLSIARKKEDMIKELDKLNSRKSEIELNMEKETKERELIIFKIDKIEKELKEIGKTGETDALSDQV